jgi:diguanylate cyclase (GGDEF)-like protein
LSLLVGRLNVDARVDGATLFAQHTAALLDVSLALRREQDAAVTDALTGLLNRRGFDVRLNQELERASHTGSGVALLLADCDDLKAINDRGGHELGDRVLEAFASCVRGCKRTQDAGARIGGDEFAVVLPGAGTDAGTALADRLRSELGKLSFREATRIEATFGIASFPEDGTTAAELLRTADRAL